MISGCDSCKAKHANKLYYPVRYLFLHRGNGTGEGGKKGEAWGGINDKRGKMLREGEMCGGNFSVPVLTLGMIPKWEVYLPTKICPSLQGKFSVNTRSIDKSNTALL